MQVNNFQQLPTMCDNSSITSDKTDSTQHLRSPGATKNHVAIQGLFLIIANLLRNLGRDIRVKVRKFQARKMA